MLTDRSEFEVWWSSVSRTWLDCQSYKQAAEEAFRAGQETRPTVSEHETTKSRLRGLCMAILDSPFVLPHGMREAAEDHFEWLVGARKEEKADG